MTPPGAVYTLDVLWWGVSIGGKHYTATIDWSEGERKTDGSNYHHHELERTLSLKDAKLLDPDAGERYWISGIRRKTNRFDTREQLERWATKWVQADAKRRGETTWLLIEHDAHNPHRPVSSQGWDKDRLKLMTDIAATWDKTTNAQRGNKVIWDRTYALWNALIARPGPIDQEDLRKALV